MKKFILAVLIFIFALPAFADGSYFQQEERLTIVSGTTPTDKSLDVFGLTLRSGTSNSRGFEFKNNQGASCAMEFDAGTGMAATAGVTIVQQCSADGETWYTPTNTSGTALGTIATNIQTDQYIQFTPVVAPFIRFTFTNSGTSCVINAIRVITTRLP